MPFVSSCSVLSRDWQAVAVVPLKRTDHPLFGARGSHYMRYHCRTRSPPYSRQVLERVERPAHQVADRGLVGLFVAGQVENRATPPVAATGGRELSEVDH